MGLDILIILLAVGASIFSAVAKKRRDAQRNTQTPTQPIEDDPWAEIQRMMGKPANSTQQEMREQSHQNMYEQRSNPSVQNTTRPKKKVAKKPAGTTGKPAADVPYRPENETADDIAARFNVRDAVIFSEILKPKFDEY